LNFFFPGRNSEMSALAKPEFITVDTLRPETEGHFLKVKVLETILAVDKRRSDGSRVRIAEAIVGDHTGSIVFTLRDDQIDLCVPGATIEVRNAKIDMALSGFMRLVVDKWGKIFPCKDQATFQVNTSKNLSAVEYELVQVNNE